MENREEGRQVVILLRGIGHLIRVVQRGKGKVWNLLEDSCIPSRLGYQMGIDRLGWN